MRVLVAGFKHETNTFASNRADWAAFERGESFPKPTHGDAMCGVAELHSPAMYSKVAIQHLC